MNEHRVGLGVDFHRLAPDRPLVLGGLSIPYHLGLVGHSDADVLTHAICDALLGAAGLGDIGVHFPDTDPQYKGIDSLRLLEAVAGKVCSAGYELVNVDATVIAEEPKLTVHFPVMCERLAAAVGLSAGCINLKATTRERMGSLGRGEGMGAWAVCLIRTDGRCPDR